LKKDYRNSAKIKAVGLQLKEFPQIEEIQYGRREWVETFPPWCISSGHASGAWEC